MPSIAMSKRVSATKSRSLTASMELAIGAENPRSSAVTFGKIGSDVPASAPAPSGETFMRSFASKRRSTSRSTDHA